MNKKLKDEIFKSKYTGRLARLLIDNHNFFRQYDSKFERIGSARAVALGLFIMLHRSRGLETIDEDLCVVFIRMLKGDYKWKKLM